MSKHTPGPWSVTPRLNNMIDVIHSHGKTPGAITLPLCRVQARKSWVAEAEANARLIAAAPELLEALRHAVTLLRTYAAPEDLGGERFDLTDAPPMGSIFAAIAKATGEAA